MIEIYFDGVLIDSDNYVEITNDVSQFNDSFYLGATGSNSFNLKVNYKEVTEIPYVVEIKYKGTMYATLQIDSFEIEDGDILSLTLTDKMVMFNFPYSAESIVPTTTGGILQNICTVFGVELATTTFVNDDIVVDYYNSTLTARDYISYIAEINGGYATIGPDGKLYLKNYDNEPSSLNIDECEDFQLGIKHKIERVVFDNGLIKFESSSDESLETLYLNVDNVYINSKETFDKIVTKILNFEFYNFSTGNSKILDNVRAGDLIKFVDGSNEYITIAQYSLSFYGGWIGGYELNVNSKVQEETKILPTSEQIKHIQVTMDRINNQVLIAVEEVETVTEKIEEVSSDVNNLDTKVENNQIETNEALGDKASVTQLTEVANRAELAIESTNALFQFEETVKQDGVEILDTKTGIKLDKNGIQIDVEGSTTKTQTTEYATIVINKETDKLVSYNGYVTEEAITLYPQLFNYKDQTINYNNNMIFEEYLSSENFRFEERDLDDGKCFSLFYTGE